MIIILLGPPGSGKGTVATLIQEKYNYPILASGELLRNELAEKSELGKKVSTFLSAGDLVPDSLMNSVIKKELKKLDDAQSVVLDGYPRTLNQARALDQLAENQLIVFYLDIPRDVLMERLLNRGRSDDTKEIINHRFSVYQTETRPLIRYYRNDQRLVAIEEDTSQAVFEKIQSYLP